MPNSSCRFWKHKSVFFWFLQQSSVPSNITPLCFLSSNFLYFCQKQPIKVKFLEIFECFGQNSLNCLCQFWTDKSIPLQISHHSSLPWHITPLQTLSSYIFYHKWIPSKSQFWDFLVIWRKFSKVVMSFSKPQISFSSNFASLPSVIKDNSSVLF